MRISLAPILINTGELFGEKVVQCFFPVSESNVQHNLAVFVVRRLFLKIPLGSIHFGERGRAVRIRIRYRTVLCRFRFAGGKVDEE